MTTAADTKVLRMENYNRRATDREPALAYPAPYAEMRYRFNGAFWPAVVFIAGLLAAHAYFTIDAIRDLQQRVRTLETGGRP